MLYIKLFMRSCMCICSLELTIAEIRTGLQSCQWIMVAHSFGVWPQIFDLLAQATFPIRTLHRVPYPNVYWSLQWSVWHGIVPRSSVSSGVTSQYIFAEMMNDFIGRHIVSGPVIACTGYTWRYAEQSLNVWCDLYFVPLFLISRTEGQWQSTKQVKLRFMRLNGSFCMFFHHLKSSVQRVNTPC